MRRRTRRSSRWRTRCRAGLVDVIVAGHSPPGDRPPGRRHRHHRGLLRRPVVRPRRRRRRSRDEARDRAAQLRAARPVRARRSGHDALRPRGSERSPVPAEYEGAPVTPDRRHRRVALARRRGSRRVRRRLLGITLATPIRRTGVAESSAREPLHRCLPRRRCPARSRRQQHDGGLRADLPAGPLTYGAVFEVMPFDNRVVAFHLTGADIRKMVAT